MKRMTKRALVAVGVVAALSVPAGFATEQYASAARMVEMTPGPGSATRDGTPDIFLRVEHPSNLAELRVTIDAVDLTRYVRRTRGGFTIAGVPMADGRHRVHLAARSTGLFGGAVERDWTFSVDTQVPRLRIGSPTGRWARLPVVRGVTEPGASVSISWPTGRAVLRADAHGRFRLVPTLPDGETRVRLSARDSAGNHRETQRIVRLDTAAPRVHPAGPFARWQTTTSSPRFAATIDDRTPLRYEASVDGQSAHAEVGAGGSVAIRMKDLAQGAHRLVLVARDAAGNRTIVRRRFGVDTTEQLTTDVTLAPGARGQDVRRLTQRLHAEGLLKGAPRRTYDAAVTEAVRGYQKNHGLEVDGVARPALIAATAGKVVVVKHLFRLFVYRDGAQVGSFPVAIGQARYPSPTGTYTIISKIKDPTWIPPNSPWAEGLEPIPPGGGNPLGPRWIGTSAPAVGIHGTPADASIGTAASHGCIRMHFADVKRVYELVDVGMPVVFTA